MSDANIRLVKDLYAAFEKGDVDTIVGAMSPDVHWENYGDPRHYPVLGARKGPEEVRKFFGLVGASHTFTEFQRQEYVADNDTVVVLGQYSANVTRTGRKVAAPFAHVFTIKGGKVVRFREFTDTATWAEAYELKDTAKDKSA